MTQKTHNDSASALSTIVQSTAQVIELPNSWPLVHAIGLVHCQAESHASLPVEIIFAFDDIFVYVYIDLQDQL